MSDLSCLALFTSCQCLAASVLRAAMASASLGSFSSLPWRSMIFTVDSKVVNFLEFSTEQGKIVIPPASSMPWGRGSRDVVRGVGEVFRIGVFDGWFLYGGPRFGLCQCLF